jgi:hypothetical protein
LDSLAPAAAAPAGPRKTRLYERFLEDLRAFHETANRTDSRRMRRAADGMRAVFESVDVIPTQSHEDFKYFLNTYFREHLVVIYSICNNRALKWGIRRV